VLPRRGWAGCAAASGPPTLPSPLTVITWIVANGPRFRRSLVVEPSSNV
jgi:hypothetical protein